jgi:WD40 repeat protein
MAAVLFAALVSTTAARNSSGAVEAKALDPLFSFRADHMILDLVSHGSQLLVGTQSGRVEVFDWRKGTALPALLVTKPMGDDAFAPTIRSIAVSPSGRRCAVLSSDGRLRVFALASGVPVLEQESERPSPMVVRFLDEDRLLLGNMRGELSLLDLVSGHERYRRQLEYDPIFDLGLSPDRSLLAVALRSSRIHVVDPVTGETRKILKGHRDSVFGVVWLGDRELASGGKDKHLLVWDLLQQEPLPRVLYRGDHYITALGADRTHTLLALPLEDHRVGLLDWTDGRITRQLDGHTAPLQALLFVDDGRTLISAGRDARIFVWRLESNLERSRP